MFKKLVTLLAVISFSVGALAAGGTGGKGKEKATDPARAADPVKAARDAELARVKARKTGENVAAETKRMDSSDLSLDKIESAKISDGAKSQIKAIFENAGKSNVEDNNTFMARALGNLLATADAKSDAKEKSEILRFAEEALELNSIRDEKSGGAARTAIEEFSNEISKGKSAEEAAKIALGKALKLTGAALDEKVIEFLKACLGRA